MSYDRDERPKATQATAKSASPSPAPKPKQWGGESGLGQRPTNEMLRKMFASAFVQKADAGVPAMDGDAPSPDEQEVNWATWAHVPPDPFQPRMCLIDERLIPADPMQRSTPTPLEHHGEQSPLSNFQPHDIKRTLYWTAISADSKIVHESHAAMGPELVMFRHAEKDDQLGALGYKMGSGWTGDVAALTDAQSVPKQGGMKVGGLFDKSNQLIKNKHDEAAIASTGTATKKGRGKTEEAALGTVKSDALVQGALALIKETIEALAAANSTLVVALEGVTQFEAQDEMDSARGEIEQLKGEAEQWKEAVELVTNMVTGVVHGLAGETGDAISSLGTIVSTVVSHLNSDRLEKAEAKLAKAERKYKESRVIATWATVDSARASVRSKLHGVVGAKAKMQAALTDHRAAYNQLGMAAGSEIQCPEGSQHRISAMLAAIPLVEVVVARARAVRNAAAMPAYTKESGIGLGMAEYHREPNAPAFKTAVSEMHWARDKFAAEATKWEERLAKLMEVKTAIIGESPGSASGPPMADE